MSGATVESHDALGLVHGERRAEERTVVVVVEVEIAPLAVELLGHVVGGVEFAAILDGGNGHLLDVVHRKIDVFPVVAVVGMAVVFHLIGLVVRTARVVHRHDERAVDRTAHRGLVELQRGVFPRCANGLALLVGKGEGELLHGLAEGDGEDVVDGAEHLYLALLQGCRFLAVGTHLAQFEAKLPQLRCHNPCHAAGVLCRIGLGLHALGHEPVFLCQVGHAAEGAAIIDGILEEEAHALVVDGLVVGIDDALQHEVGFLKLVVEEEVVVRELHRHRVVVLTGEVGAEHIEPAEHPAASAALLVVYRLACRLIAEVGIDAALVGEILRQVVDGVRRDGVEQRLVGRPGFLGALYFPQHIGRDAAIGGLGRDSRG